MTAFDFTNVKATTVKPADVPAVTRTRKLAENPMSATFAKSMTKEDAEGKGQWLALTLPIIEAGEKAPLGTVIRDAARHIRNAAANVDKGSEIRTADNGNGTATLHFRSAPRRARKAKTAE
jgi:hypothetical protein